MTETFLVYALAIVLAWPLGRYMAAVMRGAPMRGDALFGWIERPLYALLGTRPQQGMSWRGYSVAFLLSNLVLGLLTWAVFMTQAVAAVQPGRHPEHALGYCAAHHGVRSSPTPISSITPARRSCRICRR